MTTIIADARLGVMLSDSHWTDGDEIGPVRKVWRAKGSLIGIAGSLSDAPALLAWFRRGCPEREVPKSECIAMRLSDRGIEIWARADGFVPVPDQWAIGTGGAAARAALMAGASPRRALQIVKLIDAKTSGPIRTYRLRKA